MLKWGGGGGGTKWDLILFRQTHPENVRRTLKLPVCQRIFTLFPKSQKILMMTSENAISRNFARDFMSFTSVNPALTSSLILNIFV